MDEEGGKHKSRVFWTGLGFLYMWACALLVWVDLGNSNNTFTNALAFLGGAAVSISGIAIAFYTSSLEEKVKKLEREIKLARGETDYS